MEQNRKSLYAITAADNSELLGARQSCQFLSDAQSCICNAGRGKKKSQTPPFSLSELWEIELHLKEKAVGETKRNIKAVLDV